MAAVAPMDLVVRSDPASIPLQCTLCPKKPKFSDLSHLLTHISSKSHLAHRFKAELRARDDPAALEDVGQYDTWCERYGINALLAERMAAKEQKRTGRRSRPTNTASNKPAAAAMNHHGMVKPDPDEYNELPGSAHWATASGHYHEDHHGHFDHSAYHTPNLKRSRSDRSGPSTPDNTQSKYYRRWPSETETADSIPISDLPSESTELDDDNDISKLKGVRYPGMGLFDSADETQKRMRNQRKDDSVLKHMEETSSGIVPNEFVWAENGDFQRIRDIYASPSIEGSPDRKLEDLDAPKPRRGRRSTAGTAAARTRASGRVTRATASRNKRAHDKDPLLEDEDDNSVLSGPTSGYDVFRDPPKRSSAQLDSPLGEQRFDLRGLRRRPALQSMTSNMAMVSSAQQPAKTVSYLSPQEAGPTSFASQPPVPGGHYFPQHTMGSGTFNPLCVQARGGYYNPYSYPNFGNEHKHSTTNFQAINTMNLGNMPFNAFGGPFTSDSTHERVDQDFEL